MRFFLASLFVLFFTGISWAQSEPSTHEVKPGETVYGISKQYDISTADLIKANPDIKDGLKEGMSLVIPPSIPKEETTEEPDTNFIVHEVVEGETLFSLSKKFSVEIEDIKKYNPALIDGLKLGQLLKIPKNKTSKSTQGTALPNDFHYHEIQPGETAYSLSKKYSISLDSLYLLNPDAANGLKISQLLKLPLNRKKQDKLQVPDQTEQQPKDGLASDDAPKKESQAEDQDTSSEKFFLYKIVAGDSFFSLKQKFNVSRERLIELNPELANTGIELDKYIIMPGKPVEVAKNKEKTGWLDRLFNKVDSSDTKVEWVEIEPISKDTSAEDSIAIQSDSIVKSRLDKRFEIALLLPFNIPIPDSIEEVQIDDETYDGKGYGGDGVLELLEEKRKKALPSITRTSIEFYNGFLMAIDSLTRSGMEITLKVYDTRNEIQVVLGCMDSIIKDQPDLVVGPLLKNNVEWVADKLKEFDIPVISPLSRDVSVLGHPNLIQCRQGSQEMSRQMANIINAYYESAHIIFAHSGKDEELKNVQFIKAQMGARTEDGFMRDVSFTEEMLKRNEMGDVIVEGKKNVFVIASEDKVFLSDLVNKLRRLRDTSIYIVGPYKLMDMPTLEVEYLNKLHLTMADPSFVDYEDSITIHFIESYRERFETEPSDYAYQGYDIGLIYLYKLSKWGDNFLQELPKDTLNEGLYTRFQFIKTNNGGFRNQPVYTTGVRDLTLIKLD